MHLFACHWSAQCRAAALAPSPSLWRQDAHWAALPVTGGAWPPAVPDAWLRTWRWRA